MSAPNREQAPAIWWSRELGLIWSEDEERSFRYVEGDRVRELFRLPSHAYSLDAHTEDCTCGRCD